MNEQHFLERCLRRRARPPWSRPRRRGRRGWSITITTLMNSRRRDPASAVAHGAVATSSTSHANMNTIPDPPAPHRPLASRAGDSISSMRTLTATLEGRPGPKAPSEASSSRRIMTMGKLARRPRRHRRPLPRQQGTSPPRRCSTGAHCRRLRRSDEEHHRRAGARPTGRTPRRQRRPLAESCADRTRPASHSRFERAADAGSLVYGGVVRLSNDWRVEESSPAAPTATLPAPAAWAPSRSRACASSVAARPSTRRPRRRR